MYTDSGFLFFLLQHQEKWTADAGESQSKPVMEFVESLTGVKPMSPTRRNSTCQSLGTKPVQHQQLLILASVSFSPNDTFLMYNKYSRIHLWSLVDLVEL